MLLIAETFSHLQFNNELRGGGGGGGVWKGRGEKQQTVIKKIKKIKKNAERDRQRERHSGQ